MNILLSNYLSDCFCYYWIERNPEIPIEKKDIKFNVYKFEYNISIKIMDKFILGLKNIPFNIKTIEDEIKQLVWETEFKIYEKYSDRKVLIRKIKIEKIINKI